MHVFESTLGSSLSSRPWQRHDKPSLQRTQQIRASPSQSLDSHMVNVVHCSKYRQFPSLGNSPISCTASGGHCRGVVGQVHEAHEQVGLAHLGCQSAQLAVGGQGPPAGGLPQLPLLENLALTRQLHRAALPWRACAHQRYHTTLGFLGKD